MNLVLFVNQDNIDSLESFTERAATLQEELVNGALILVHDYGISSARINELAASLRSKFKVSATAPVHVNGSLSREAKLSAMFAGFLINVYSTYPGPWLVIDQFCLPTATNFMQLAERQHNAGGKGMSGRMTKGQGWLVPQGPITLSLPAASLKFLRFNSNEGWRERGKFHFARCGFSEVPIEEYLFTVSEKHADVIDPQPPEPPAKNAPVEELSDEELFKLAQAAIGPIKIHPATGRKKLLAILANAEQGGDQ